MSSAAFFQFSRAVFCRYTLVKARSCLRIILVLLFAPRLAMPASTEFWRSDEFNVSIHLPAGTNWVRMSPPEETVKLIAGTSDKNKIIIVSIYPTDQPLLETGFGGD